MISLLPQLLPIEMVEYIYIGIFAVMIGWVVYDCLVINDRP